MRSCWECEDEVAMAMEMASRGRERDIFKGKTRGGRVGRGDREEEDAKEDAVGLGVAVLVRARAMPMHSCVRWESGRPPVGVGTFQIPFNYLRSTSSFATFRLGAKMQMWITS